MVLELIVLFVAVTIATLTSCLFLYGVWRVLYPAAKKAWSALFGEDAQFPLTFGRAHQNPILPLGSNAWEAEAVINPAAVHDGERTHLFYRAIGKDGVSRIGYASSADGVHMDERLPYPVFAMANDPDSIDKRRHMHSRYAGLVASGGSWSGTEDPRAVLMNDRVYLTFSAFNGWESLRMAMTSISLADLNQKRWSWTRPTFLSASNQIHKNWVLFPEKINGKYAVLHSVSPDVEIAYVDDLEAIGKTAPFIQSEQRVRMDGNKKGWETRVRGSGPPPIRTAAGWLVLYHAHDAQDPNHYKLGAMLLDLDDPTKVLARSFLPVLAPEAAYERTGAKPGIVYACGTTVVNDILTVYYGAADTVVCAAATSLSGFLAKMTAPAKPAPSAPTATLRPAFI